MSAAKLRPSKLASSSSYGSRVSECVTRKRPSRVSVRPPMESETRLRAPSVARELRMIAARFRAGDFHAALVTAMHVLDEERPVPILCASHTYLAKAELTSLERVLLALVNGSTPLEEVIEASGLGLLEGIATIAELLDQGIVSFDPSDVCEPKTMPCPE